MKFLFEIAMFEYFINYRVLSIYQVNLAILSV